MGIKIRIDNVRLAFPYLYEPQPAKKQGDREVFKASFLFPPEHPAHQLVKDAMVSVAKEQWKDKAPDVFKALKAADKVCLHDGALKALKYDGYDGMLYVNASSQIKPKLKDRDPKAPEPTKASGLIYSGCYVNGVIEIYTQDNEFGQRINATLLGVQRYGDGPAFAGGATASDDDFETYPDGETSAGGGTDDDFFG